VSISGRTVQLTNQVARSYRSNSAGVYSAIGNLVLAPFNMESVEGKLWTRYYSCLYLVCYHLV